MTARSTEDGDTATDDCRCPWQMDEMGLIPCEHDPARAREAQR